MALGSDHLRTFAVFAEETNLSRAAKRLHLSQPAVHAQLKALAGDVGAALYRRAGRGLVLTEAGVEVAAFAREEATRASELLAKLRGDTAEQPVVVAAGAGAIVHLLAPGLRAFAKRARIEVITADAGHTLDLVRRGSAHVGVGVFAPVPHDLDTRRLAHAEQVLVVRRGDPLARKRRVELTDLAGVGLIVPPQAGPQRLALDAALAAKGVEPHITAVARGWDVVLRLVEVGVGLGIVNATCVVPRTLVTRPLVGLTRVTYLAVTRPKPRPAVLALLEALVAGATA